MKKVFSTKIAGLHFLIVWLATGIFISTSDLGVYRLQYIGIDAWVTHHTAEIGKSTSQELQPFGDAFAFKGKLFPAKQPGQFIIGALPYYFIKKLGISLENDYMLAAALIAFFTSGLMTAFTSTYIARHLARKHTETSTLTHLYCASFFLCTQWFVYSSICHHDILAACILAIAACKSDNTKADCSNKNLTLAGVGLGLTLCISMLPAAIVVVMIGYCILTFRTPLNITCLSLGFCCGLAPLLWYNLYYFGNPWVPANIAGQYTDTYPLFNPPLFLHHLNAYFGIYGLSQWLYSPVLAAGIIFSTLTLRKFGAFERTISLCCISHIIYICSIETLGTCSFGPRYLLPLIPLIAFSSHNIFIQTSKKAYFKALWITAFVYGFFINLNGKVFGSANCKLDQFSFITNLQENQSIDLNQFPLILFGTIATSIAASWAALCYFDNSKTTLPKKANSNRLVL